MFSITCKSLHYSPCKSKIEVCDDNIRKFRHDQGLSLNTLYSVESVRNSVTAYSSLLLVYKFPSLFIFPCGKIYI